MIFQVRVTSKWTNDSQRFLLEHFDTIHDSPSHIYHSALPLSPPSWLQMHYNSELSPLIKPIKGIPAEWGMCSRTTVLGSHTQTLSYHNSSIAVGSIPGDIIIFDTVTGTQTAILSGHTHNVTCIAFSLDGSSLVSGSNDKTAKLWDVQTGGVVKTFSGHTNWVLSVSISADYTTVASGSQDSTMCLWDIKTGECCHNIAQGHPVCHVMFSPTDPQYLISISDERVWQWDVDGYEVAQPFDGNHASFSSDGAQFISCYGRTVTVHNSRSRKTPIEFQITNDTASLCSFSPNNRFIAVAANKAAYCWDIASSDPQLVKTFITHTADITSLTFSSPTTLILASVDKSVKFWQIGGQSTDTTIVNTNSTPLPSAPIMSITLQAEDGIVITSDSDGMVKTWDILTGTNKATSHTPAKHYMRDVRLIDGRLTLVYHADKKIYVWDVGNEKLLLEAGGVYTHAEDLRISGDGSKIFHLHAPSIWILSIQTGMAVSQVKIRYSLGSGSLIVDGSKVWAHWPYSEYQGWDFGVSGSNPIELSGIPTLSNGDMLWDPRWGRIKSAVTGGVIFQLSGRFANPADAQCHGSHLVTGYESGEVLILNLKDVPP